jgi:hypothetical protein
MMIDRAATESAGVGAFPSPLPPRTRHRIFLYLGGLIFLVAFGSPFGGLIDIPITFLLKNKLRLTAPELAAFRLLAATPLYLSFVFGFIRDNWSPFGMRDRGLLRLFGTSTAVLYGVFAFIPISYESLFLAVLLVTTSFLFVASAQNELASMLGQHHAMSGQISAVWNIFTSLPTIAALLVGGTLSDLLENQGTEEAGRLLFLVGAAAIAAVAVYTAWQPASMADNVRAEPQPAVQPLRNLLTKIEEFLR